jgi:tRNA dimethylallyltransferase
MTPRFPIIIGPTAGGKSALALSLVDELRARRAAPGDENPAELVSADAFQVYRGMDVGTAKPTAEERARAPHHLIDLVEPSESFTVAQWLKLAEAAIAEIRTRSALPIVVGGTHLYVKALIDGLFEGPDPDPAVRAQLAQMDPAARRDELQRVDPAAAARIHPADDRRTIRALEVCRTTGRPISDWQQQWGRESSRRTDCVLVFLDWPTEAINRRINARVRGMIDRGLVDEARNLWQSGRFAPYARQAREALGYKQLIRHFEGACTLDEAIEQIKIETRRFAKNQRTWIRRLGGGGASIRIPMGGDCGRKGAPADAAAAIADASFSAS